MKQTNRREFLQSAAILTGSVMLGFSFETVKKKPFNLSFSTLGCPDWPFKKIVEFAQKNQYNGLEMRGILRQVDLTQCPEFSTPANRTATMQLMKNSRLSFVNLGSSAAMHFAGEVERKKNLDEGRKFIDLAHEINCPYIRVFPNNFPKDMEKQATMELITKGLQELGNYAKDSGVMVLMETHGDLVYTADIEAVMQATNNENVGLVWDISNMWTITKEQPAMMYEKLKKYIMHTHIKDAKLNDGKLQYVFLGRGDVPIINAINILKQDNYKGFYSFEWEKMWHPEIDEPTPAITNYAGVMRAIFSS